MPCYPALADGSTVWERPSFCHSEAISIALDESLRVSGLKVDDIDAYDLYSWASTYIPLERCCSVLMQCRCFPIVPKLACHHLSLNILSSSRPLTLLGGLTSFGGAGNNYSMHVSYMSGTRISLDGLLNRTKQAITEMTRQIRSGNFNTGLVLANGGVLSYQHALCLSARQKSVDSPYHDSRVDSDTVVKGLSPRIDAFADGEAVIEVSIGVRTIWHGMIH